VGVRGLFDVHDPASPRMDVAAEQLATGLGFVYENVWFRREGAELWCAVISPWYGPGLGETEALGLIAGARDALAFLLATSPAFTTAAADSQPRFLIIRDNEISWDVVAELVGDKLVWRLYDPTAPAD
jgi:hypothetical protein